MVDKIGSQLRNGTGVGGETKRDSPHQPPSLPSVPDLFPQVRRVRVRLRRRLGFLWFSTVTPYIYPMFPLDLPRLFPTVHCDDGTDGPPAPDRKKLSTAISAVKGAISVQESELKRWKRIFDTHAKLGDDGEKYVIAQCLLPLPNTFIGTGHTARHKLMLVKSPQGTWTPNHSSRLSLPKRI